MWWQRIVETTEIPWVTAGLVLVGSFLAAFLVEVIFSRTVLAMARKTKTELDDQIVEALRRPIFYIVIFIGVAIASMPLDLPREAQYALYGVLETLAILVCSSAALGIGTAVLHTFSRRAGKKSVVQPRTVPVFDMLAKILVFGLAVYFIFLAWRIDVTAWLASAGIIGIAIGFAARDSLANFFAGIFIIADAPYKVGDFIVINEGMRGRVTRIGMRSTRILSRDDVEINVPNALIGNSTILNEVGGPSAKQRTKVTVAAAYGSDVDQVIEVMLTCTDGVDNVSAHPTPEVRFREFGDSGLIFDLLLWVDDPAPRGRTLAQLNVKIYKAFKAAGIEIPYSKHDVYIKQMAKPAE